MRIVINSINFTHYRLEDLIVLANQAKPFYDWIERNFQKNMHLAEPLDVLMRKASREQIKKTIEDCYYSRENEVVPKLFDGGGIPYEHSTACFFMFAWMARDAATQRLRPLILKAKRGSNKNTKEIEIEVLSELLFSYKDDLLFFDWPVVREITMHRLEGSRRAKKGSLFENYLRIALANAFSFFLALD